MKRNFKQLEMTGEQKDYYNAESQLTGMDEFRQAIMNFYRDNMDINPRQLHYLICAESNEEHLMCLLGSYDEKRGISETVSKG